MPDRTPPAPAYGPSTRIERVALLREVFEALIAGQAPSREAALFVGGGGLSWLLRGGDVSRDFWRVAAPRGSQHTPDVLASKLPSSPMNDKSLRIDQALVGRRVFRLEEQDEE